MECSDFTADLSVNKANPSTPKYNGISRFHDNRHRQLNFEPASFTDDYKGGSASIETQLNGDVHFETLWRPFKSATRLNLRGGSRNPFQPCQSFPGGCRSPAFETLEGPPGTKDTATTQRRIQSRGSALESLTRQRGKKFLDDAQDGSNCSCKCADFLFSAFSASMKRPEKQRRPDKPGLDEGPLVGQRQRHSTSLPAREGRFRFVHCKEKDAY
ncbi:hypothetical protein AVEN_146820-1 [Araneus ventricosus]|uniref:Uncharacterized protein n=1 Tax=Araneus ventricosus TaxID=182803 RepID=A0A4Y2K0X4_ARAVE|nr:hypothetical protein AVEN_9280-1 [Araneus ventricosus]GBM95136.1 hypothetical protein AVEN_268500-1 [Araneus ventricosus]GBM95181.1 hypothetical protein AVEN_113937-1 [Araneus ventricosus]GBM95192.1 hypothetical protein AVEN_146820-1 [Araneus ventricosus]